MRGGDAPGERGHGLRGAFGGGEAKGTGQHGTLQGAQDKPGLPPDINTRRTISGYLLQWLAWDPLGRIWVCVISDPPQWQPFPFGLLVSLQNPPKRGGGGGGPNKKTHSLAKDITQGPYASYVEWSKPLRFLVAPSTHVVRLAQPSNHPLLFPFRACLAPKAPTFVAFCSFLFFENRFFLHILDAPFLQG